MKNRIFVALALCCSLNASLVSCKKQTIDSNPGKVEFAFGASTLKNSALKADTISLSSLVNVIVTIEDLNGKTVKTSEKIELYNMNGSYISKPISLPEGSYKLSCFLVLDWKNNVVYASPLNGSAKAYLVTNPLPLAFNVSAGNVVKVTPEVLNAADSKPEDFGYLAFSFDVAKTFDFLIGTFVYNDTIKNFKLAASNIAIYTDTTAVLTGQLVANTPLVSLYDSIGITNKITLPERFNSYKLIINKPGYQTYAKSFTKDELKLYFRSADKGPLVVVLEKLGLADGLVAYYKFNGDVLDYSGNNNNGAYYGRGLFSTGYRSETNGAVDFNGSSDYIVLKNSASLNPTTQISICAWYYSIPFYGSGSNFFVCKIGLVNGNVKYQYSLGATGSLYPSNTSAFGFNVAQTDAALHQPSNNGINTTGLGGNFSYKFFTYNLYKWYFVVDTYDGQNMKLYVNGDLKAWRAKTDKFEINNNDVYIGSALGFSRPAYDFLAGKLDEIRIYNRALSDTEILNLYQQ